MLVDADVVAEVEVDVVVASKASGGGPIPKIFDEEFPPPDSVVPTPPKPEPPVNEIRRKHSITS